MSQFAFWLLEQWILPVFLLLVSLLALAAIGLLTRMLVLAILGRD